MEYIIRIRIVQASDKDHLLVIYRRLFDTFKKTVHYFLCVVNSRKMLEVEVIVLP